MYTYPVVIRTAHTHIPISHFTKWALAILIVSATGCGGGSASETTPTNPEPTQPSLNATSTKHAQIDLGTLRAYAILAGADIDNVPPSRVIGNVALPSAMEPTIDLSCTEVEGAAVSSPDCRKTIDILAVQSDLSRIDQELAAKGRTAQEIRGDLGNKTLLPGTYKAKQTLEISAGDLILEAQGDANAVWVFLIAGDLQVASGRRLFLSGGAQAGNIYWRVRNNVHLGEYSVLHGNILANDSIRLMMGAYLEGRAWTTQGPVQLISSTIHRPGS